MSFLQLTRATAVCMLLLFISSNSFSQNKTITGKITDARDGSPAGGANISGKGTRIVVQSKNDGTYTISVPSSVNTLVVSWVGFATQEIAISGSTANAALVVTNTTLNEVVVIGYGTQRRKEVT